jgi:DNA-binding transcriptional LysR family regulator
MQFKGLDLNLLVVLDALLTRQSITQAADQIYLSQSATSGALARLREYFNDELLVQVGHKMVLTSRAEDLIQPVRALLVQAEAIIGRSPGFSAETSTRNFKLMMSDYAATVLMPGVLQRIQQVAPGVTLEIMSNIEAPARAVERGEVDFLIAPKQFVSEKHPFASLYEDGYVCIVWAENALVGNELSLDQYLSLGHAVARLGKDRIPTVDTWFLERLGNKRRIEVVAMTFALVPHLLIGSTRIATLPEFLARLFARYLPLRLVPPPVELPKLCEFIQWHTYREGDRGSIWLRNLVCDVAQELRSAAQTPPPT